MIRDDNADDSNGSWVTLSSRIKKNYDVARVIRRALNNPEQCHHTFRKILVGPEIKKFTKTGKLLPQSHNILTASHASFWLKKSFVLFRTTIYASDCPQLMTLDSLHHIINEHKNIRSWQKNPFWRITKCFDMNSCLLKRDFMSASRTLLGTPD